MMNRPFMPPDDNRPFMTPSDFIENQDLVRKIIKELHFQYSAKAKKEEGILSNHDLENIFKTTTTILELTDKNDLMIAESLYDGFAGSLIASGDSGYFFSTIEVLLDTANGVEF